MIPPVAVPVFNQQLIGRDSRYASQQQSIQGCFMNEIDVGPLGNDLLALEKFYQRVLEVPKATRYSFNLSNVKFMTPTDIVGLILASRFLSERCAQSILMTNPHLMYLVIWSVWMSFLLQNGGFKLNLVFQIVNGQGEIGAKTYSN